MKQNAEYRSRLARIHADSAFADMKGLTSPFHIVGSGTFVASGPPSERVFFILLCLYPFVLIC